MFLYNWLISLKNSKLFINKLILAKYYFLHVILVTQLCKSEIALVTILFLQREMAKSFVYNGINLTTCSFSLHVNSNISQTGLSFVSTLFIDYRESVVTTERII